MKNLIIILRWIAVLPTMIIANIITSLIVDFCIRFWGDPDSYSVLYYSPVAGALFSSIASVTVSASVAPKYKKTVAFIIMILLTLLGGIGIFLNFINHNYFELIKTIFSIAGCILGYFLVNNEESNKDNEEQTENIQIQDKTKITLSKMQMVRLLNKKKELEALKYPMNKDN